MKTIWFIPLLIVTLLPAVQAENVGAPKMRDASTHDQLVLAYRNASNADPMRTLKAAKGSDPSIVNQPKDLVSDSDILCFGGIATLVPKRAILHIPPKLADRLKFQQGSQIQSWSDFFALNRGWITTVEVSRAQAEGNKAIAEEISERIGKSSNLVVATYLGGPISVLPLKVPAENANQK